MKDSTVKWLILAILLSLIFGTSKAQPRLQASTGLKMSMTEVYIQQQLGVEMLSIFYPSLSFSKGLQTSDRWGIHIQGAAINTFYQKVLIGIDTDVKDGKGAVNMNIEYRVRLAKYMNVGLSFGSDRDGFNWQMRIILGTFNRVKNQRLK